MYQVRSMQAVSLKKREEGLTMNGDMSCTNVICTEQEYQEIEALVEALNSQNARTACESLKQLEEKSEQTPLVYSYMDTFAQMIQDENSYVRNRGLALISANAKWDRDNKIDEMIDEYLKHIMDEKPITARQCIKGLPRIARYKEELRGDIVKALVRANPQRYADSMAPLVQKDIAQALKMIGDIKAARADLMTIPGIGKNIAQDLIEIGITCIDDLKGKDPEDLYRKDCLHKGYEEDRCQLYTFRCAVYYADHEEHEPEKLKWWYWKDKDYPEKK